MTSINSKETPPFIKTLPVLEKHVCRVGFKLRNVSPSLPAGAISDDYNFIALSFCPSQIPAPQFWWALTLNFTRLFPTYFIFSQTSKKMTCWKRLSRAEPPDKMCHSDGVRRNSHPVWDSSPEYGDIDNVRVKIEPLRCRDWKQLVFFGCLNGWFTCATCLFCKKIFLFFFSLF